MLEERIHWHVSRDCLQDSIGKDVLYDTMNREDPNGRKFHEQVAHKTIQSLKASGKKAYVVDDTVEQRFGKKMPGISSLSIIPADGI